LDLVTLAIEDLKLIKLEVFEDQRGFFCETFNEKKFMKLIGRKIHFVQDNHSRSIKGVLRGLHYQKSPFAQAKIIKIIKGEIFDVMVDIRKNSATYGQWVSHILNDRSKEQLWIPEGFAHGFLTLSDYAEILYKTTNFYNPASQVSIKFDDPSLNINWPKLDYIFSENDLNGVLL
jgi:dTDP-4-dehydrorhamnose 3,5-epimerase